MPFGPYSTTFSFTTLTVPVDSCVPTPTLSSLREAIRVWAAGCLPTDWVVIFADQNSPAPSKLSPPAPGYLTLRLDALLRPGFRDFYGNIQQLDTDVFAASLIGDREFTVSVGGFGPGALQVLEDIRSRLDRESVLEVLRTASIAVVQSFPIQNLTGLYDTQFTERGNLDVRFRTHAEVLDQDMSYIQRVQGEGQVQAPPNAALDVPFDIELS